MKIKFGAIIVAGSGKIGGHVASKNRAGAYLRTKVTPTNPNTGAQAKARGILGTLSTQWGGLTQGQRQSFNDAVTDYATTDIFGDSKNPSGINLYVKLNANLINAGLPQVSTAPNKEALPYSLLESVRVEINNNEVIFNFDNTDFATVLLQIKACAPQTQGTTNVTSKMRTIGIFLGDSSLQTQAYIAYVARFGTPTVGDNIVFSVAPVIETGQAGTPQQLKSSVVA